MFSLPLRQQVLTALELARQARIAANRAYLAGLGLGPQAMNCGQVQCRVVVAQRGLAWPCSARRTRKLPTSTLSILAEIIRPALQVALLPHSDTL